MPSEYSIKQLLIESFVFISMFALAGHLTVNFWEKYVIQTELSHVKNNLNSMKNAINNIGNAYDNLYKELKGLHQINGGKKQNPEEPVHRHENTYRVNHKSPKDVQVHTVIAKHKNRHCLTKYNNQETNNENKKHAKLCNATTITKYPVKSTKVGSNLEYSAEKRNCPYIRDNKPRNHYKYCDKRIPSQNHWKF